MTKTSTEHEIAEAEIGKPTTTGWWIGQIVFTSIYLAFAVSAFLAWNHRMNDTPIPAYVNAILVTTTIVCGLNLLLVVISLALRTIVAAGLKDPDVARVYYSDPNHKELPPFRAKLLIQSILFALTLFGSLNSQPTDSDASHLAIFILLVMVVLTFAGRLVYKVFWVRPTSWQTAESKPSDDAITADVDRNTPSTSE
jgi:hypothetical protein